MVTAEDASKEIVEGRRRAGPPYRSSEFILVHLPGVTSRDHCMERNTWIGQRDFTRVRVVRVWRLCGRVLEGGPAGSVRSIALCAHIDKGKWGRDRPETS